MANAVTFWKGPKAQFDTKTIALGRIYFVTDDDNNGSLYLGVQGESAVEARLISPARLTALTAEITDNLSTVTAKAVVDFVKAQIEESFGADSDYATKIAEIEGRLDNVEGILAGYGDESDSYSTVKAHVDAVEAIASEAKNIASAAVEFKGVIDTVDELPAEAENGDIYYVKADDTEYVYIADKVVTEGDSKWEALGGYVKADVYTKEEADAAIDADVKAAKDAIDAYTVNGKAISTSPVLTGADIAVDGTEGAATVAAKLGALQDAIDEITGTGEDGDPTSIAGLAVEISNIKNYTVNGKKISENPVLAAADIADVYSKTEVEQLMDDAVLVWEDESTSTEA